MSQKITAKNLTYDNSLPPFLARLRGQQTAHSGPDPILAAQRRPGQKRSASEEAEDAPVVVDEDGNLVYLKDGVLDVEDGDKKDINDEDSKEKESPSNGEDRDLASGKEREKVAVIGASRKRKVGRVIGDEQSDDEKAEMIKGKKNTDAEAEARIAKASADVRRLLHEAEEDTTTTTSGRNNSTSVPAGGHKSTKAAGDKPGQQQQQQQQKTIKSTKKKAAKKIKLSFGDNDDGE
ncbi:hypothetical protein F5Y10DRAFT_252880 [Nemania abortiva]|nr:hypothetical protein F5Y10DRAFT_252880 [Nemania abortiva]